MSRLIRLLFFPLLAWVAFPLTGSLQAAEQHEQPPQLSVWLLPEPVFPADNPYSEEKAELGKILFFDPRISPSQKISCASCHNPGLGWADGMDLSVIAGHHAMPRHTPSLINVAYRQHLFWDGRASNLESAIREHLQTVYFSSDEMLEEIADIPDYRQRFHQAFKSRLALSRENISAALATYLRTIIQRDTPFDRWIQGDQSALSAPAQRGFELFTGKASCVSCHHPPTFSDSKFHPSSMNTIDPGRYEITHRPEDKNTFCTPPLRQIAVTAPYMHAGQKPTLASVLRFYNHNPQRQINTASQQPLGLTHQEMNDLKAFLKSLTGNMPPTTLPSLPINPQ